MTNFGKDFFDEYLLQSVNESKPSLNVTGLLGEVHLVTKSDIADAASNIRQMVDDGYLNPLSALVKFKIMKELIDRADGLIKSYAIDEADKYKKQGEYLGYKIDVRNTGDRLNYEDDPIYAEMKAVLKQREELLKLAYKQRGTMLFDENGIEVPVVSVTAGKDTVFLTLK